MVEARVFALTPDVGMKNTIATSRIMENILIIMFLILTAFLLVKKFI
jgi:hypothetical protein